MAEKDQPFVEDDDDDFDTDDFDTDFDAFEADDDDDFSFDDNNEESPFQFDEDDMEMETETEESESADEQTDDSSLTEDTLDDSDLTPAPSNGNLLDNWKAKALEFIEKLKNEEPKTLIKYGIGAFFALLFIIGSIVKIFSGSAAPATKAPTPTTKTSLTTQQIAAQNNLQSANTQALEAASNQETPTLTPVSLPNTNESLADLSATSGVAAPASQGNGAATTSTTTTITTPVPSPDYSQNQQLSNQNSALTKRVSDLEMQISQLNNQLTAETQMNASNQAQITTLIKSIDNMQSQMAKLNNAMQVIVQAVGRANNNNSSGFINPAAPASSGMVNGVAMPDYYVQAVIPGRAWLKNADGQILTVIQGDAVPGYGTVTMIDAQNGIVVTSTGVKFAFGIDVK